MLGKGSGQRGRILEAEVVAICDHLRLLFFGQLKHEIRRESRPIALDLLIQALGGDAIRLSQIRIEQYLLAADYLNRSSVSHRRCECAGPQFRRSS